VANLISRVYACQFLLRASIIESNCYFATHSITDCPYALSRLQHQDVFATAGANRATVYEYLPDESHFEPLQVYIDERARVARSHRQTHAQSRARELEATVLV
jgi:hypothetical protein